MIIVGSMVRLRVYNDSPVHKVPVLKHVNLWHYDFPTLFFLTEKIKKRHTLSFAVIRVMVMVFKTPFSTIYQLYRGGQFNRWRKTE